MSCIKKWWDKGQNTRSREQLESSNVTFILCAYSYAARERCTWIARWRKSANPNTRFFVSPLLHRNQTTYRNGGENPRRYNVRKYATPADVGIWSSHNTWIINRHAALDCFDYGKRRRADSPSWLGLLVFGCDEVREDGVSSSATPIVVAAVCWWCVSTSVASSHLRINCETCNDNFILKTILKGLHYALCKNALEKCSRAALIVRFASIKNSLDRIKLCYLINVKILFFFLNANNYFV